jgi:glycosyltransferase involved in cell wall biosynthesis
MLTTGGLKTNFFFAEVSLLITHYNRSESLTRLLESFEALQCRFEAIIVSDDASQEAHLQQLHHLQKRYSFQLITSPANKGLANNINKGQRAVTTPYTLYIQEDFQPLPAFPKNLEQAMRVLKEDNAIDLVRFYAYFKYPCLRNKKNGFATMQFNRGQWGYKKFYQYSDHPHIRRSQFLERFGPYKEGIKSDKAEYVMMLSFLQKKGKGVFYENFQDLFIQKNSTIEPSTVYRNFFSSANTGFLAAVKAIYRTIKLHIDFWKMGKG